MSFKKVLKSNMAFITIRFKNYRMHCFFENWKNYFLGSTQKSLNFLNLPTLFPFVLSVVKAVRTALTWSIWFTLYYNDSQIGTDSKKNSSTLLK